jgi:hypothetical protein
MVAISEVIERLAGAGIHPAGAVQRMRHLMDAGIIRRGPRGRPSGSTRFPLTISEVADVVFSLAAMLPINGPQKVKRLASYVISEPGPVVDPLFNLPDPDATMREWLIAVLTRLTELSRDERKSLYLADPAPILTFRDELTSPYPYADAARFEWEQEYIKFHPPEPPMRNVLEERLPKARPCYSVAIEVGLLLDLSTPENAAAPGRVAASPIPADAEQPLTTTRRQPGPSNPKVSVGARESNRSVELVGQIPPQETPHAPRHRRRT